MKASDFLKLAEDVRAAQKRYFTQGRLQGDLIASKKLEAHIDKAIIDAKQRGFDPEVGIAQSPFADAKQGSLFLEDQSF